MPRGGKRQGAGRKPGSTAIRRTKGEKLDAKMAAMRHADAALQTLVRCLKSEKGAVALSAAREILDRAYGKPPQAVAVTGDEETPIEHIVEIELIAGKAG